MTRYSWVAALFLFAASCSAPEPQPNPHGLKAYVGKELRVFNKRELAEFHNEVEALTGDRPQQEDWGSYEPWWVKSFAGGIVAWVYLEAYPGYDVPDASGVQIHMFDESWTRLVKQDFPTGYRMFLHEVALVKENPLKQDLLAAKVTYSLMQRFPRPQDDHYIQYYALLGDRFVMVRLEDKKGAVFPNHYAWEDPSQGPPLPERTSDEWIHSLRSEDPVEQLATMVWLSGTHLSSTEPRYSDHNQESVEDSRVFESVRNAADTRRALRAATDSTNPWVQEYARDNLKAIGE